MPDTKKKKVLVKVSKKSVEAKEAEAGIIDLESTAENKLELTQKYSKGKEDYKKNLQSTIGNTKEDKEQGISINKNEMKATPKIFVRKVIKSGGDNGTTKILSEDGKSVNYEGRSNMKATQDAVTKNEKQTTDINSRREYNANNYDVQSGAKKKVTESDVDSLVGLGKAVRKKY